MWLPIWVTILVIRFLVKTLDSTLSLLPHPYQPDVLLGFHVPGLGVIVTLVVIFSTGMIAANFIGKKLVALGEAIIRRIPLVRSVYTGVKQVSETLFSGDGKSFRKVWLVRYPHPKMWSIAFQTGEAAKEVARVFEGEPMINVFIPTTPNPTSGFLVMIARKDAIPLAMSVDQALKLVISLGVVQPHPIKDHATLK